MLINRFIWVTLYFILFFIQDNKVFAESIYYISITEGSNRSESKGSREDPWKFCPGMTSWNKKISYTHQSGDIFIFKGGDVWNEGIEIQYSGDEQNPDKYYSDSKWPDKDWTKPVLKLNKKKHGIAINGKTNLKIKGIKIEDAYAGVICVNNAGDLSISDVEIFNSKFGVRIEKYHS